MHERTFVFENGNLVIIATAHVGNAGIVTDIVMTHVAGDMDDAIRKLTSIKEVFIGSPLETFIAY